ncbi:hypothetical protein SPDO_09820 [Sphingomonas dokdonensis]|uniref:Uncharacterized protein n=1 Tax=Sphingomonas dokdonensis TaxID=344880 RepID=A0A245ZWH3_9SPHN|nr:hypothetical protein SPDO_09820 [Sphingomonas dokdonensis]
MDAETARAITAIKEVLIDQQNEITRLTARESLHHMIILRLLNLGAMGGLPPELAASVERAIDGSMKLAMASGEPEAVEDLVELLRGSLDQPAAWKPW